MESKGQIFVWVVLALVAGFAGGYFWARSLPPSAPGGSTYTQRLLLAEGENQLLRKMLGEIPAKVILLAPTPEGKAAFGKMVWDESRQEGLLFLQDFPEPSRGFGYALAFGKDEKNLKNHPLLISGTHKGYPSQSWSRIESRTRMLGAKVFQVIQNNPETGEKKVILRGFL
jgi:hypothetical protein